MRRYEDPVEVRGGTDPEKSAGGDGRPEQFLRRDVVELSCSWTGGRWQLVGCAD